MILWIKKYTPWDEGCLSIKAATIMVVWTGSCSIQHQKPDKCFSCQNPWNSQHFSGRYGMVGVGSGPALHERCCLSLLVPYLQVQMQSCPGISISNGEPGCWLPKVDSPPSWHCHVKPSLTRRKLQILYNSLLFLHCHSNLCTFKTGIEYARIKLLFCSTDNVSDITLCTWPRWTLR